jgi:hypothetical protein
LKEDVSVIFVGMEFLKKNLRNEFSAALVLLFFLSVFITPNCFSQQPNPPSNTRPQQVTAVYLLNIVPKDGGKSFTLFHKTKVIMTMNDGRAVTGKVAGVGRDSISIDYKSYAVKDIAELRFNPGSALGVAAAIATTIGLVGIALTIDNRDSDAEKAVFYGGIGLAVVGGITLIPTYFLKKRFNSNEYVFSTVMIGGY